METLRKSHQLPPQCSDEHQRISDCKKLVILYRDESITTAMKDRQDVGRERSSSNPSQNQRSGIMVADFIDEHNGFLCLTD